MSTDGPYAASCRSSMNLELKTVVDLKYISCQLCLLSNELTKGFGDPRVNELPHRHIHLDMATI